MTVSTSTTFELTASDLVISALEELGAIAIGEEPEDAEMEACIKRLNLMLTMWSVEGNLFREASEMVTITGGTGAATLPTNIRDISSVRHIISATNYRMLFPWNRDQYHVLPNRAAIGNPTCFYYSQQLEGDQLRIWPVPVADITLEIDYSRAPFVVTANDETVDIPQEWQEAALYGLAARCAGMFGAVKLDPNNVMRIQQQASALYERLLDADRPDSYVFEPYNGTYC